MPQLRLLFEPRDLWVGVYWTTGLACWVGANGTKREARYLRVYLCLVPMLPLRLIWTRETGDSADLIPRKKAKAVRISDIDEEVA